MMGKPKATPSPVTFEAGLPMLIALPHTTPESVESLIVLSTPSTRLTVVPSSQVVIHDAGWVAGVVATCVQVSPSAVRYISTVLPTPAKAYTPCRWSQTTSAPSVVVESAHRDRK